MKTDYPAWPGALMAVLATSSVLLAEPGHAPTRQALVANLRALKLDIRVADPTEQEERWQLMDHAVFLQFRDDCTLVPRGALIHLPQDTPIQLSSQASSQLLPWREFLGKYPAAVGALELSLAHASGSQAISPEQRQALAKAQRVIVAVLQGNPISLPPTTP